MRRSSDTNTDPASDTSYSQDVSPKESRAYRWNLAALVVVVVTSILVLFVPTGSTSVEISMVQDEHGARTETITKDRVSLMENEGFSVLVPMAIPVVMVGVPLVLPVARRRPTRAVVAGLLSLFIVLGMMSIGVFFIPTLTVMMVSVLLNRSKTPVG